MNCDEAEELLGAYALDALLDDEAAAMRTHIAGCEEHAAKVAGLRAVALELPALAEPMTAPPQLRARLLDAIADEAATPRPITRAASTAPRARVLWHPSNRFFQPNAWSAIAAALVIALGGLLAWNLVLVNRDDSGVSEFATRATSISTLKRSAGGNAGTVVYFGDDKKALVILDDLPPLDSKKNVYEMWAITGDVAKGIGLIQSDGAQTKAVVPFDANATQTIAITIEPAGGSDQPTTAPIIIANCIACPT